MSRLYLVRHGENRANLTKELSHRRIDYPLTEKGRLQAEQTAARLGGLGIRAVFSSPLLRARETAEAIAKAAALPLSIVEELREVNVGELELEHDIPRAWTLYREIILAWLAGERSRRFPGGETMHELVERFRRGMERILSESGGQDSVVVGHGGIFTFCLPEICEVGDRRDFYRRETHNCAIGEIEVLRDGGEERLELRSWARVEHLSGEAADFVSAMPRD